VKNLDKYMKIN